MNWLIPERTFALLTCFLVVTPTSLSGGLSLNEGSSIPLSVGDWLIEVVEDVLLSGGFVGLRVGPDDYPHIEYSVEATQYLKYGKRNETEWDKADVDQTRNAQTTEGFAVGPDGVPHICFSRSDNGVSILRHAFPTKNGWESERVDKVHEVTQYCSIFVDKSNEYHISYQTYWSGQLWYAHFNGTNWSTEVVDDSFNVGRWSSMIISPSGAPSIAYEDYQNHTIRYATKVNDVWNVSVANPDQKSGGSITPSLDFGLGGEPHIVYVGSGVLKMTSRIGSNWVDDELLPYDAPYFPSFKISSTGEPHIAYWAGSKLNYTTKPAGEWLTETLIEMELFGTATSIDLDSNDLPHCAFIDHRNGIVYYATKANFSSDLPPIANSGGPYLGQEGSAITFDGSGSSDPEGGTLSFTWDFDSLVDSDGDGNFINDVDATGPTPAHTYYDNRNYAVTLTVTDVSGQSDTSTNTATILNVAPTAKADGPFEGDEPHTVQFTGTFTDPGTLDTHTFQWDFDFDGITFNIDSTEQNPTHQWLDDFNGTVAFKVTDDDGGWDLDVTHVTIINLPPNATANGPYHSFEGTPIQFTGNHTDPGPLDTHTYEWDFSYDGTTFNSEATGNPHQKTWWDDYSGNIALRVTDDDGGWGIDVTNVTIGNVPPKPEWTSRTADGTIVNPPYPEGKKITFDATVDDPGINDTFTYDWDFGDGTVILDAGPSVVHAFGDNDTYLVVLTVTDDDGGVGVDDTPQLGIYNVDPDTDLPVPLCTFYEGSPGCPLAGTFSDPGWLDTHVVYWEFGDGSAETQMPTEENDPPDATGNFTTTHVYGDDGEYKVNATVIDDDGGENTSSVEILITNIPPSLSISEPSPIYEGQSASVTVNATDPGSDDIHIVLDWGDGTSEKRTYYNDGVGPDPPQSPLGNYPFNVIETFSHVYGDNGVYKATVTVTDDDRGETNESVNITVLNVAPSTTPFGPFTVDEGASLALNATSTDPGSDDLTFTWKFEMGPTVTRIHYNDGMGPDPYPSPGGVFPFTVTDTVNHVYGDNGVYNVTLTVEDDDGGSSTHTTTITVNNIQPAISAFGPFIVDEGSPLAVNATAADPGSDDLTLAWAFELGPSVTNTYYNDGVGPDPYPSPNGTYPFTITDDVQQTYGDNGVFNVTLTVEDDDGGSAAYKTTITVNNVAPSIAPFGPFTADEGSLLNLTATSTDPGSDDLTFTWELELGPTMTIVYYNDGLGPDPYPSPGGSFPFTAIDTVEHTYGDNGVFNVTLTVEDDDGGTAIYATTITMDNVAPTVDFEAYILVSFTLRIAGEKWHNVEIYILEDDEQIGYAEITRFPGNPDDQTVSTGEVKCDITETITAKVLYTPEDDPVNGQMNGANPVWLTVTFEDDTEVELKHTFNVQHPETWEWNVNINPYLLGHEITFEATATDPGSDDLTFTWNWGDGSSDSETTHYNDGVGPDPYPSPGGMYPFTATDEQKHTFTTSGVYIVTLTVEDDDGGSAQVTYVLTI